MHVCFPCDSLIIRILRPGNASRLAASLAIPLRAWNIAGSVFAATVSTMVGILAPMQTDCNMTCTGNAMEVCGAHNRSSTYSNASLQMYQPKVVLGVQTSQPTEFTPTITPSRTGSTSQTAKVALTTAAVIGVAGGVPIMIAPVYLFWRIRRNRQTRRPLQRSHKTAQEWPLPDPVASWEDFPKATEEVYARVDENNMFSSEGNRFGLGPRSIHVEHRPSIPELRERYELQLSDQQTYQAGSKSSDIYAASPTRYSTTPRLALQGPLGQPTSILKRPATPGIMDMAQGTFELEDRQVSNTTGNLARAKKGVRFGVNQIREFGRTPVIGYGSDSSIWSH